MGVLVYVLGRSGTGKSYSMRNFAKDEIGVVNVQGKILPFKGSGSIDIVNTDSSDDIVKTIKAMAKKYKIIVVDDFQYVMANEFMRRATERGYDKFTEIAKHAWDVADCVRTLPADVIVYVMCHTDTDQDGFEKLKTIGKLLDEKIVLEGMSTIVLKTAVSDGQYMFLTQNNGKDTVKSPEGMFPAYAIDNDLKYVDEKIRSYYELGEFLTDEEMKEKDAAVAHDEVAKEEPKKRSRSRGKKEEAETTTETTTEPTTEPVTESAEAPAEPPKRTRRRVTEAEELAKAGVDETGKTESVPFDEVEVPQRKRRTKTEEVASEEAQEETSAEAVTSRRRRRRA
jgi:hypothetical protein